MRLSNHCFKRRLALALLLTMASISCSIDENKFLVGLPMWTGHEGDNLQRQYGPPESRNKLSNGNEIWRYRFGDDECKADFEIGPDGKILQVRPVILDDCHHGDEANPYFLAWKAGLPNWQGRPVEQLVSKIGSPKSRHLPERDELYEKWNFQVSSPKCAFHIVVEPHKKTIRNVEPDDLSGCGSAEAIEVPPL